LTSNVTVTLNGEEREIREGISVAELIRGLELPPEHVAVELNRVLVRRASHADTPISEGDVVEVVTLVGGG
jgi:thiamine biosynthesis protein ThiS